MSRSLNLKVDTLDEEIVTLSARREELETEISLLEEQIESKHSSIGGNKNGASKQSMYEFDDKDKIALAFDKFYADVDPQLEKIRDDLLKESKGGRRFPALSARLGR